MYRRQGVQRRQNAVAALAMADELPLDPRRSLETPGACIGSGGEEASQGARL